MYSIANKFQLNDVNLYYYTYICKYIFIRFNVPRAAFSILKLLFNLLFLNTDILFICFWNLKREPHIFYSTAPRPPAFTQTTLPSSPKSSPSLWAWLVVVFGCILSVAMARKYGSKLQNHKRCWFPFQRMRDFWQKFLKLDNLVAVLLNSKWPGNQFIFAWLASEDNCAALYLVSSVHL